MRPQPVQRGHETRHRRGLLRPRAVPRLSQRGEAQPVRHLLRHLDRHLHPPVQNGAPPAFVEHVAHVGEQLGALLHEPADPEEAAGLLVGRRHEDDVAVQRHPGSTELEKGREVNDAEPLGVDGPAAIDHAVADLARQGSGGPVVGIRRHHVDVVQQHEARRVATGQSSPDIAAPRRRLHQLVRDALRLEDCCKEPGSGGLVAWRVHGVDPDVLLQPLDGLIREICRRHLCGGRHGSEETGGNCTQPRRCRLGSSCPHFSPAFVARASRRRGDGAHGLNDTAGVVVTTVKRREGVRPVNASGSAAAAEGW